MAASIRPAATQLPCTAAIVGLRKSWMRRQRSKYIVFSWWNLPSGVSRCATHGSDPSPPTRAFRSWPEEKCLPAPGEDDDTHRVVGVGEVEGSVDLVDERRILGVGDFGPVHGDGRHRPVRLVADRLETLCHVAHPP